MQNTINNIRASMQQARDSHGQPLYDARETRAIIDLLLEDVCGITRVERVLHPDRQLTPEQAETLLRVAVLLGQGIPVQQALGYAWFCDQRFIVTSDVLIPRPETAELVDWIVADASRSCVDGSQVTPAFPAPRILDVGTGSGCIALTLARLIHSSQVVAIDLSTAALDVARRNADQLKVDNVSFAVCDILAVDGFSPSYPQSDGGAARVIHTLEENLDIDVENCDITDTDSNVIIRKTFDIIVSNPPYICEREAAEMSDLVTQREPGMALFVPDADPLLFYRAIARYALSHLSPTGALYFEINAAYGEATCQLLRDLGFPAVELRQDCNGRDRMVRAAQSSFAKD